MLWYIHYILKKGNTFVLLRPFFVGALSSTGSLNEYLSIMTLVLLLSCHVHPSLHVSVTAGRVTGGRLAPSTPGRKVTSPVTTWLRPTPYRLKSKSSSLLSTPPVSVVRFVSSVFVFSLSLLPCLSPCSGSSPLIRKVWCGWAVTHCDSPVTHQTMQNRNNEALCCQWHSRSCSSSLTEAYGAVLAWFLIGSQPFQ